MTATSKGRGRPAVGPKIEVRLPDDMIERIDKAAEDFAITRAEMVRWILASWAS